MRSPSCLILLAALAIGAAPQDAAIGEARSLVVLIESGSGTEIRRGGAVLASTDDAGGWVVGPADLVPFEGGRPFSAILGAGTPGERVLAAELRVWDSQLGVAAWRIRGPGLPKGLEQRTKAAPVEKKNVILIGYPRGGKIREGPREFRGSVASVLTDIQGNLLGASLAVEPVPGALVLDPETGALGMVAPSRMSGLPGVQLAPTTWIAAGYQRALAVDADLVDLGPASVTVRFRARGPGDIGAARSVSIRVSDRPLNPGLLPPQVDGAWVPLPEPAAEHPMKVEKGEAVVDVLLRGEPSQDRWRYYQVKVVGADGRVTWSGPAVIDLPAGREAGSWGETPEGRRRREAIAAGLPFETGTSVAGTSIEILDAKVTKLLVGGRTSVGQAVILPDGKAFAMVEKSGIVRRISLPDLREERQFVIGKDCSWITRTRSGLAVMVPGLQECWILDEVKLAVKRKIPVGDKTKGGGAASSVNLVAGSAGSGGAIVVVNTADGKLLRTHLARDFSDKPSPKARRHKAAGSCHDFGGYVVESGGEHLYCSSGGSLHRYRIESGGGLALEESGPPVASSSSDGGPVLSADSKWIAVEGQSTPRAPEIPGLPQGGSYVFRTSDLQEPVTTVPQGVVLGFDRETGRILGRPRNGFFATWDTKGNLLKRYNLPEGFEHLQQAHGLGGGRFLLVGLEATWLLEVKP